LYDDHGHDVTDPECVKCWQRIAHESQMAGALAAETLDGVVLERDRLAVELARRDATIRAARSWIVGARTDIEALTTERDEALFDARRLSGLARAKAIMVDQLEAEVARLREQQP
jgi:hypothetical protein